MKKILCFALTMCMLLGTVGVSAYSDVKENTYTNEAVTVLSDLGILHGFEDGTFKPDEIVTRAQMAKIICLCLGYDNLGVGETPFIDVPADHWAAGFINTTYGLKIIVGNGDGTFGPEDPVTYEQALKMIVCALGYEPMAATKGGWYQGYVATAVELGLTDKTNDAVGQPASRGTIACAIYNALDTQLMDQNSYSFDGREEYTRIDDTILSKYLKIKKYEGIVTEVPYSKYADGKKPDKVEMTLSNASYEEYQNGILKSFDVKNIVADCANVKNANSYLGKKVTAYIGEDDGDDIIYSIVEETNRNETLTLAAKDLVENDTKGYIYYESDTSNKDLKFTIAEKDLIVIKNFEKVATTVENTNDLITLAPNGVITFVSNNNDRDYNVIIITAYDSEPAVIESIDVDDGIYTFNCYVGGIEDIDTEDDDVFVSIIRDGKEAKAEDLATGDVVSAVGEKDFRLLYVSSNKVEGKATGKFTENGKQYVTIDKEDYAVSSYYTDAIDFEDGIFYLDVEDEIVYHEIESTITNNRYGIITAIGESTGINNSYQAEVIFMNGKKGQYDLYSKVKYGNISGDKEVYAELAKVFDGRASSEQIKDSVYEITLRSDDTISRLEKVKSGNLVKGKEYDAESMSYGSINIDKNTVIFVVDKGNEIRMSDITVGKAADYFVDGEGEDYELYPFDTKSYGDITTFIIGYGLTNTVSKDGQSLIVSNIARTSIPSIDETGYLIKGLQDGKMVEYTFYDENNECNPDELEAGDVILIGAEVNGIVSEYRWLYDVDGGEKFADSDIPTGLSPDKDTVKDYTYDTGLVTDVTNTKIYTTDNTDGIVMKSAANYILVDKTNGRRVTVEKKSKGTSIFALSRYNCKVYIRYNDDVQIDVIVYRYNKD